jgi:hypothetical protein
MASTKEKQTAGMTSKATLEATVVLDGTGLYRPEARLRFENGAVVELAISEWTSAPGQPIVTFKAGVELDTLAQTAVLTKTEVQAQRKAEEEALAAELNNGSGGQPLTVPAEEGAK